MDTLGDLWLPIVVSAAIVFAASALVWMVLPHHKGEWKGLSNESAVLELLRGGGLAPGLYMFPFAATPKDRETPEMTKKLEEGPVGVMTVMPSGKPNMGKSMLLSFAFNLVVSFFAAYVARHTLAQQATYPEVFRIIGSIAIAVYVLGSLPEAIWFGRPWKSQWKAMFDGLLYGLLTAGTFGWLWPRG